MLKITKMHGAGNDYIYVNGFEHTLEDPSRAARELSDRHFWIGSDGLVLIQPSDEADFRMEMYNSDGSRAEMCGNAIRCVGKFVYDNSMTEKKELTVATDAGIKRLWLNVRNGAVETVRVDMGEPVLRPADIPVLFEGSATGRDITVGGRSFKVTCVSMGNPHAVVFLDEIDGLDLETLGPQFERHPLFPHRVNTEFVKVIDRSTLKMRVWERGAGETWACGTGACAALVAASLNNLCERRATLILRGGELFIEWDLGTNRVFMSGGAVKVFDALIDYK